VGSSSIAQAAARRHLDHDGVMVNESLVKAENADVRKVPGAGRSVGRVAVYVFQYG